MLIRKRTGQEVEFDKSKIQKALTLANKRMSNESDKIDKDTINKIVEVISSKVEKSKTILTVEDIQDLVQKELCKKNKDKLFEEYTVYRYIHAENRAQKNFNKRIMSICNNDNEEVKGDNANKNPTRLSAQRDYLAGTVSKDIYFSDILPEDIIKAHQEGILHQHDADYSIMKETNCCLVDLIDMLWNGTIISDILIEQPHSFSTACNIATQIIAQVASSQFGGQSISLAHLVPFVGISRQYLRQQVIQESKKINIKYTKGQINKIVESRLKKEIEKGIQTINFQILTLMTTNGQTPFITLAMFRNDIEDVCRFCRIQDIDQLHKDFNLLVEEVLKQRLQGVKIENGTYISPIFPKLIYCIDSTNCDETTPNWYLTKLAAECTSKRMVPDYVSEKKMLELRGECFTSMGK